MGPHHDAPPGPPCSSLYTCLCNPSTLLSAGIALKCLHALMKHLQITVALSPSWQCFSVRHGIFMLAHQERCCGQITAGDFGKSGVQSRCAHAGWAEGAHVPRGALHSSQPDSCRRRLQPRQAAPRAPHLLWFSLQHPGGPRGGAHGSFVWQQCASCCCTLPEGMLAIQGYARLPALTNSGMQ